MMGITTKTLSIDEWPEWRSLRLEALADAPAAFGSALSVKSSNLTARRMYERNHFRVDGNGDRDDEIRMVRILS